MFVLYTCHDDGLWLYSCQDRLTALLTTIVSVSLVESISISRLLQYFHRAQCRVTTTRCYRNNSYYDDLFTCSSISLEFFTITQPVGAEYPWLSLRTRKPQPIIDAVVKDAIAGCEFCRLLYPRLESLSEVAPGAPKALPPKKTSHLRLQFLNRGRGGSISISIYSAGDGRRWYGGELLYAISFPADVSGPHHATQPTATTADSKECFERCRYWLTECTLQHDYCKIDWGEEDFLPTRLLYIPHAGSDELPRLVESKEHGIKDRRYLNLSHCYGEGVPDNARTTTGNVTPHLSYIDLGALLQLIAISFAVPRSLMFNTPGLTHFALFRIQGRTGN